MNHIIPYKKSNQPVSYGVIDCEKIRSKQIIGYDHNFLSHCLESNKVYVTSVSRIEKRIKLRMSCDNGHEFLISPYYYYVEGRQCPHCKCKGDKGALNIDSSIISFWNDERYNIEDISEFSKEYYKNRCPFCGLEFMEKMINLVNRFPKCKSCKDGQALSMNAELDEGVTYLIKERRHK